MEERQCDVLVVGAGVVGCAIARELSRLDLDVCVVEKAEDVCCGTSKANSGIVHAGFDAAPGSLMARLNREGADLMPGLCRDLDVPFAANGALVLCFDEKGLPGLELLLDQARANGVPEARIVDGDEARAIEPAVSPQAVAALWAPTSGIVDPFLLTVALAENAAVNGARFCFDEFVRSVTRNRGGWRVDTSRGAWRASAVVNAAGVCADRLYNLDARARALHVTPRRGAYLLLDKDAAPVPRVTLFQLPGPLGKGVLVAPTCHGNTLVGPTAQDVEARDDTATTAAELARAAQTALLSVPDLPLGRTITSFAGLRAHERGHEFVVEETSPGFFHAAGIESPGLTSAPAIGRRVAALVGDRLCAVPRAGFVEKRWGQRPFCALTREEQAALVARRPEFGRVLCRCEVVTAGDVADALARPVPPHTLDGLKRRLRLGMGRCQGGFCTPLALEELAALNGTAPAEVRKGGSGSWVVAGSAKGAAGDVASAGERVAAAGERAGCGTTSAASPAGAPAGASRAAGEGSGA